MLSSFILQVMIFISGMILPQLIITHYGSKVYGLIASIQQFLGFITLGEMGIGAVIQFNLYKPLANRNWMEVSKILTAAKGFFNNLLKVLMVYILFLAVMLSLKMHADFDFLYTFTLVLSISISYIMQYYFGMTFRQLIDADQLSFVRVIPQIIQIFINLVACTVLITNNASIQVVKMVTSILYSLQPVVIYVYCKKHYKQIELNVNLSSNPIQQKWNGIAQHIAATVLKDTDVVVLTLLGTLESVSVYAIYNLIISGIEVIIESTVNNFMSFFGELIAREKQEELRSQFSVFESLYRMILIIIYFCIGRLIVPFITVYTKEVTDTNYIVPTFALLLTTAHWLYCARLPYHIIIKAAGHYKQTQNSAILEAVINIVVSVAMVHAYGIIGVAIGTMLAMLYRNLYYLFYLKKNILVRPVTKSIKIYIQDILVVVFGLLGTSKLRMLRDTYFGWALLAILVFVITTVIAIIVRCVFDKDNLTKSLKLLKKNVRVI